MPRYKPAADKIAEHQTLKARALEIVSQMTTVQLRRFLAGRRLQEGELFRKDSGDSKHPSADAVCILERREQDENSSNAAVCRKE